ncbi:MAG: class I SAM-dependent methyltransferase [Fuerstiella sp.]|nr:class I SAM-dependent methyltransferase [Fuerstiella sp.]
MPAAFAPAGPGTFFQPVIVNKLCDMTDEPDSANTKFAFGKNWAGFLETLNDKKIKAAQESMQRLLGIDDLQNRRFLDAGSGSGLFSLSAYRLGAQVTSFDVDHDSVGCAQELRERFCEDESRWIVLHGSLTDTDFLKDMGRFDVVYCWGVAHHTGQMWSSIDHLIRNVDSGGLLVLAIYNDQLYISRAWYLVKRIYQRLPGWLRPGYVVAVGSVTFLKRLSMTLLAGILRLVAFRNPLIPFTNWIRQTQARGMHGWHDLVDWVGGWPFEVARPEEIFRFMRDRGFQLQELITSTGHGCNEFVFVRTNESTHPLKSAEVV